MILLSARGLVRQFDAAPVLDGVSFDIRPGERIGLVGPNGAGKTTLLRLLAGEDPPDTGHIERHATLRCGVLEQRAEFPAGRTLLEEARSGLAWLYDMQAELERLGHEIAAAREAHERDRLQRRFDDLQTALHRESGFNVDHRVDAVLTGLGFTEDQFDRPLSSFSGGQQNRVLLAKLLAAQPNLLLLDEPTNHLDIATTEWLERWLANSDAAMVIVSHDRYFLDKTTTRILELHAGKIADYPGNFSAYWRQRDERLLVQQRTWEKQQEEIADLEDFIRRNHYGQLASQAKDREKKLARIERVEKPSSIPVFPMGFAPATRTADVVIEADAVAKGFGGPPLFADVRLRIARGTRVGIFGPNGCGKTTLLRVLIGELPPDSGRVRRGTGVRLGYFDQQLQNVDPDLDLVEAARPEGRPDLTPAALRDVLARFGLRGEIVFQRVRSLSGGERSKLALARLAIEEANVLVLDEPTNHLDLWACESLETSLQAFQGTVLFVSHDRYFLDRVATHLVAMDGGRWEWYEGNYTAWVDAQKRRAEEREAASRRPASTSTRAGGSAPDTPLRRRRKFPYRKVEDLEAEIHELESRSARLLEDLADPAVLRDGEKVRQTQRDFEMTRMELERLYEHWEEAVELNG